MGALTVSTETNLSALHAEPRFAIAERTSFKILLAVSVCHLLNDTVRLTTPMQFTARDPHLSLRTC